MNEKIIEKILASLIGVILVGILIVVILQPYIEMNTFNKFSSQKVTYWEAMFTNLRVIPPEEK